MAQLIIIQHTILGFQLHTMDGADQRRSVSPIPFSFGERSLPPASFTFEKKRPSSSPSSPDVPRQSIEHHDAVQTDRDDTPSTTMFTPLGSPSPDTARRVSEVPSLSGNLGNLRLASAISDTEPQTCSTPPERASDASPTPSIQVTLSPSKTNPTKISHERADSVVNGMASLRMRSSSSSSLSPTQEGPGHSPSPSRRRRSGSGVPRPPYRVEDEELPPSLFHSQTIQQSLVDARAVVSRMAEALASSTMPQDESSSIRKFRQQALKLSGFQPPSSRTVGLVGDSGVGKSSLINSLLDKKSLARAVSDISMVVPLSLTMCRATVGLHVRVSLPSITTTTVIHFAYRSITLPKKSCRSISKSLSKHTKPTNLHPLTRLLRIFKTLSESQNLRLALFEQASDSVLTRIPVC
jgi:hypothetical protein